MKRSLGTALTVALCILTAAPVGSHDMSMPPPISQPTSPVRLESCYLGTNFIFGDAKLLSEQTKMQLNAELAKPVPAQYQMLGLRFEFGAGSSKRSADVIVFTGSAAPNSPGFMAAPPGLSPSGYLPRVSDYNDYRCGVDFATSLDWKSTWFDYSSDVVACSAAMKLPESGAVWLTALELSPSISEAVFIMADEKQNSVAWGIDGAVPTSTDADGFGRAVVPLGQLDEGAHVLAYGPSATSLHQQVCFRPFLATR